jgi:methylglyoxal/glyoxal reductase
MNIDKIGFGTYKIKSKEIIKKAIKIGYRTIDTADLYNNHQEIRDAIKESGYNRNEFFIVSKIKNKDQVNGTVKEAIYKILDIFEYIDLLLLHAPMSSFIDSWKILENEYKNNKIKKIGVSNFRIDELRLLLKTCKIKPYLNQIEISPFNTRYELTKFCKDNDIIVQAYSSLTRGFKLKKDIKNIEIIKQKYKLSTCQILLKWAYDSGYYIIPMSTNYDHMKENFIIDKLNSLDQESMHLLNSLNENYYTIPHFKDKTTEK